MPVSRLQQWLPHRGPAIWVDQVNWVTENEGECQLTLRPEGHYLSTGGLRQTSLIEWIAQSYGFVRTCQMISQGPQGREKKPEKAYLVAIRDVEWAESVPQSNSMTLRIHVRKTHQVGPIALVEGHVYGPEKTLLAKAQLRLYAE